MYALPQTLEVLNISNNQLQTLKSEVTQNLKNLTTLDISKNCLTTFEGIQPLKRLKRLIAKSNLIRDLAAHLAEIHALIEVDIENNQIDSYLDMLRTVQNKPDLLVFNLKLNPIMTAISTYD